MERSSNVPSDIAIKLVRKLIKQKVPVERHKSVITSQLLIGIGVAIEEFIKFETENRNCLTINSNQKTAESNNNNNTVLNNNNTHNTSQVDISNDNEQCNNTNNQNEDKMNDEVGHSPHEKM